MSTRDAPAAKGAADPLGERLVEAVEGLLKVIVRGRGEPVRRGVPLNQKQRMALREAADRPGIRFHELAAELGETKATTSRVVSSLRELNLVLVAEDPIDRRTLLIAATPAGRKLALQRRVRLQEVLEEAFVDISDEEKERFIALLSQLGPALRRR